MEFCFESSVAASKWATDEPGPETGAISNGNSSSRYSKKMDAHPKGKPPFFCPIISSPKEQNFIAGRQSVCRLAMVVHPTPKQQSRRRHEQRRSRGRRWSGRRDSLLAHKKKRENSRGAATAEVPATRSRELGVLNRVHSRAAGHGEAVGPRDPRRAGGISEKDSSHLPPPLAAAPLHTLLAEEGRLAAAGVARARSREDISPVFARPLRRAGRVHRKFSAPDHGGEPAVIKPPEPGTSHTSAARDVARTKTDRGLQGDQPTSAAARPVSPGAAARPGEKNDSRGNNYKCQKFLKNTNFSEDFSQRKQSATNRQLPDAEKTGAPNFNLNSNFYLESDEPQKGSALLNKGERHAKANLASKELTLLELRCPGSNLDEYLSFPSAFTFEEGLRCPRARRTDRGPPGWECWPLDVPDVPTMSYQRLKALPNVDLSKREKMLQAVTWCTDITEFRKLFLSEDWNFFTNNAPQRTRDFEREVSLLLKLNYVTPMSRRRFKCVIKGFCVPKVKKLTKRTILDARAVGDAQRKPPRVELATLEDVEECVRAYNFVTELDGKGWFHQHGLAEEISEYFGLQIGKSRLAWTRLPMGWSYSVFIAHSVAQFLADFQLAEGVRILVYIDNIYIFSNTKEEASATVKSFLERCASVGAVFEVSTPTTTDAIVLGARVDMNEKTLQLPGDFIEKLTAVRTQIRLLFGNGGVTNRLLWKLFGGLMWGARIYKQYLYNYPRFTAWLSKRAKDLQDREELWDAPCHIWPKAMEDLEALCDAIITATPRSVQLPSGLCHTLHTDASDVGHGVVHDSTLLNCVRGNRFSNTMKRHTIALRELYGAVAGVKDAIHSRPEIQHVILWVDNTNAATWIAKGKANTFFGNRLLGELYAVLGERTIEVHWEPSASNPADHPSRQPHKYDGMCVPNSATLFDSCARSMSTKSSKAATKLPFELSSSITQANVFPKKVEQNMKAMGPRTASSMHSPQCA